jgi:hypothetical protein
MAAVLVSKAVAQWHATVFVSAARISEGALSSPFFSFDWLLPVLRVKFALQKVH